MGRMHSVRASSYQTMMQIEPENERENAQKAVDSYTEAIEYFKHFEAFK
jgi:hypothetical protein